MERIGHLVGDPETPGGVTVAVRGLLEVARRRGRSDRVVTVPRRGLLISDLVALRAGRWTSAGRELRSQLEGLDGLVVHGVFDPPGAFAAREVHRARPDLPVVAMPHDAYDTGLFERRRVVKSAYFALVEKPRLRACRAVVTTAPSHQGWLRARGVHVPVHTGPCGLAEADLLRAAELARRVRPAASGPTSLLYLGRWDVLEKGIDLALAAVTELPAGSVRLRLVGPPVGQEQVVRDLAARCSDRVDLVGWSDDVYDEIARADLLLMPSRKEGFGLAGLQALACGVPVLLSTRAGLSEHVEAHEGVLLVQPTVAAVAAGLRTALAELPALTTAARAFAQRRGPQQSFELLDDAVLAALGDPRGAA